jgi:hypothetical protein
MSQIRLSPDDLPLIPLTDHDRALHRQLEESVRKYFYQACDGVTQGLLMVCGWKIWIRSDALLLVVTCSDESIRWRVLNNVNPLGTTLRQFSRTAKIRVCPVEAEGTAIEIPVGEISV